MHLVMLPMRVVAGNRAPMRPSIHARPVRACASRRNNATPDRSPPAELSLHRRDMMMLVAVGAALVVPQPPLAAAAGSEKAFVKMAVDTLEETITGAALPKARAGFVDRAVLHDAGTYDPIAKTGGLNGSLRYELNRVENKQLGAVIKQVEAAKAKIDASPLATAPISFSDTLALAGLAQSAAVFKENLCGRGKDGACEQLYQAYGNKPPNCRLGRLDSTSADAEGLIPIPGAPASEYKAMFKRMGMTLKDLCVLSPALTGDYESSIALLHDDAECAKILADLEKSKRDMTRTSYEVPFFRAYLSLVSKGAKF